MKTGSLAALLTLFMLSSGLASIGMSGLVSKADESITVARPKKKPAAPQSARVAAALPPLLKEVEAKYFKASTLVADFNEADESATTHQTKKSSGKIQFKRPGKLHWETTKPDHNLLISDGKKFWFYTPPFDPSEAGQYWEKDSSQVQTKFAQGLLAGTFSYNVSTHAMSVKQKSPTSFLVIPKKGTAGTVKEAILTIDPAQKFIVGVELHHRGGNKTNITLSNIQLGQPLDDSLFHFTPPPNTERIQE